MKNIQPKLLFNNFYIQINLLQMSDQEDINDLKAQLQEKTTEFQSYKEECKHIEQMLQEDCQKKQQQIRQLKEQAIKRQKGQKMLKAQVSQFQAEIQNLKTQLSDASTKNHSLSDGSKQQLQKLAQQNVFLKEKIEVLEAKVKQLIQIECKIQSQNNQSKKVLEGLKKSLTQAQGRATARVSAPVMSNQANSLKLEEQIKKLNQKLISLQKQKTKLQKASKQRQSQIQKIKQDYQEKLKKSGQQHKSKSKQQKPPKRQAAQQKQAQQVTQTISLSQHKNQTSKLKQTLQTVECRLQKSQHTQKQQKHKIQSLVSQRNTLLQKLKAQSRQLEKQREKIIRSQQSHQSYESPKKDAHDQIVIQDNQEQSTLTIDCVLMTKRHYISPFLEIKDGRVVKMCKSTKTGFEKSLGSTKHRFDSIAYDSESVVQKTAQSIKRNNNLNASHSVIIYGSKGTSKKHLMASLIQHLKQWLVQKITEKLADTSQDVQVRCTFMKRSPNEQKNYLRQAINNKDEIVQILEQLIAMGQKGSPSKHKQKKSQKPKVRYFCLSLGQTCNLQFISTSYLNPFIKNNETFSDYLNTVVFSKLPNILQSSVTNYHIITTINPIVSLYEDCKNTLSITLVPFKDSSSHQFLQTSPLGGSQLMFSPSAINKEDLNDMTKKKLESFEKETEQAGLKVRKVQDQCNYYKNRFEQLQVRLKNLLNTHQQQNCYLKKSPVILSYQKLLKFVNSVLSRNTQGQSRGSPNYSHPSNPSNDYQDKLNMYIEQDAKSLDGY